MPNTLQNRYSICLFLGVLTQFDQLVEQLVGVRHVEVSGDDEVAGAPVVLAQEGVATLDLVLAIGAIPQVGQEDFASERMFSLQGRRIPKRLSVQTFETTKRPGKNVLNRSAVHGAQAADVALAGRHVQLDVRQPGAILSPVVLFLHEEIHLVHAVKSRTVFVDVELEGLFETEHCDAALVLEEITHILRERGNWGNEGTRERGNEGRTRSAKLSQTIDHCPSTIDSPLGACRRCG